MYLGEHISGARSAEAARQRMKRRGHNPRGHQLWTMEEDEICQRLGGDYKTLATALPRRSYASIKDHCRLLGLRPKRNLLTAADVFRLRKLYPRGSREQVLVQFPGRSWEDIQKAARYYRIFRERRPFKATGHPLIDAIRQRCFDLNYTMSDLDEITNSGTYFTKAGWIAGNIRQEYIARAVQALDGSLTIQWHE